MNSQSSSDDFLNSIFPVSLQFHNSELEIKYMEERSKITKPFKIVYLSTLFIWWTFNLRSMQVFFNYKYVLDSNYEQSKIFLIASLIGFASMIMEMTLTYFMKLVIIKGFIFSIPTCITFLISTYQSNINISNRTLFYPPIFVALLICFISMAFVYCYNWLMGFLLIFLVLLAIEICNLIYPEELIDKVFISFYILLALICISATLLYYEYQRRENFYNNYKMNLQKENTNRILNNLPLSIIVTEDKKIIEVNNTFKELITMSQNLNIESGINSNRDENNLQINSNLVRATENFKDSMTGESLKLYIEFSREIQGSLEFNFCDQEGHRAIPYEVTTTKLNIGTGSQIIFTLKSMAALQELNEMKSRQKYSRLFIASISHNFRTYLNIIMGNLDLFSSSLSLNNEQNPLLRNIRHGTTFLYFLVQDILDYSLLKVKRFQLTLIKFNFIDAINEICNLFEAKYIDKGLFLKIMISGVIPKYIHSDKMRITQVLVNLLSNSWKFTINGGVEVNVQFQERENVMSIGVKDTGIGIDSANISKLMKPFSKLEDSNHLNENGIIT